MDNDQWLSRKQVAERFLLAEGTVASWVPLGKGPKFTLIGGRARYRLSDVIQWENEQTQGGPGLSSGAA